MLCYYVAERDDVMATLSANRATPWHLWVVGTLGLIWNGFGVFDYSMTKMGGATYLRDFGMTEPQIAYIAAMPAWTTAVWALGVWGAFAGTVLLLLRSRFAVPLFALSLAGFLASLVYSYLLSNGSSIMPESTGIMNLVILSGCLFFLFYSRAMAKRGVLR